MAKFGPPSVGPRAAAVGAPLTPRTGATGAVQLHRLQGGALVTPPQWSLLAPASSGLAHMGRAIAPANVLDTHTFGPWTRAAGMDLLVGAPGDPDPSSTGHDEPGWLTWWYAAYPTAGDPSSPDAYVWSYGGKWRPTGLASDARFGAAIAVEGHDASSDPYPAYVVVGAPEAKKVYVLGVDPAPSASPRFSVLQVIEPDFTDKGACEEFGAPLLLRDLNGDGWQDLVIGASRAKTSAGHFAYVLRGIVPPGTPGDRFDYAGRIEVGPSWPTATAGLTDAFGSTLAAGPVSGPAGDVETLVLGAPGLDLASSDDAGGLCTVSFDYTGSLGTPQPLTAGAPVCFENPYDSLAIDGMEWGDSLAVANLVPYDDWSSTLTPYARAAELVVGCPGCPEVGYDSTGWTALSTNEGSAFVYGSTEAEPWILDTCTEDDDLWLTQLLPTAGAGFPSGLVTFDARGNGALDLALLQAGEDQVQLTAQVPVNGIDEPLSGVFAAPEDADGDQDIVLAFQDLGTGDVRVELRDQFTLGLAEDDGAGGSVACTGHGLGSGQDVPDPDESLGEDLDDYLPMAMGAVEAPVAGAGPIQVKLEFTMGGDTYELVGDLSFDDGGTTDIWDDAYTLSFTRIQDPTGIVRVFEGCFAG